MKNMRKFGGYSGGTSQVGGVRHFTNNENATLMSTSDDWYGPLYNDDFYVYAGWYLIKGVTIKICTTWYSPSDYEVKGLYCFAEDKTVFLESVWLAYAGVWESGYRYRESMVVKYGSSFYKCILVTNQGERPDNDDYWEKYNAAPGGLASVEADILSPVWFVDGTEYVTQMKEHANGDMTSMTTSTYDGYYGAVVYTYNSGEWYSGLMCYFGECFLYNKKEVESVVEFNENIISLSSTDVVGGKWLMEYYKNGSNPTGYGNQVLNEFFLTSVVNTEYGYSGYYNLNSAKIMKWAPGNYTIGVTWYDDTSKSELKSAINDAVWELNSHLKATDANITFNLDFSAEEGDITIYCGSHKKLFGSAPSAASGWYNGQWSVTVNDNYNITKATIKLRNDGEWHCSFAGTAMEELLQCMGCGYDQVEYFDNTIHSQFVYQNKASWISGNDSDILQILYSNNVKAGMTPTEVCAIVNPPNGATIIKDGQKLSFLETGESYSVKIYRIDQWGGFSTPTTLTIEVPEIIRPDLWEWSDAVQNALDNKGVTTIMKYTEWNAFIDRIQETLEHYPEAGDCSEYISSARMSESDKVMTARRFNSARMCIGSMYNATGDWNKISGDFSRWDIVYGEYFNILANGLNNAIENL